MNTTYILLGTNIGDKFVNLNSAINLLKDRVGAILQTSFIYETAAWGNTNQDSFLNAVIKISTALNAIDLLNEILTIEIKMGRIRTDEKWIPRIIDIDILFYNNDSIHTENLIVPHPYLQQRKFTLIPLNEIAADYLHPVFMLSIKELLVNCEDDSLVVKYKDKLVI